MSKIVFDASIIKLMSFFETITHAKLKDCIVPQTGRVIFIVHPGQLGKAVGKGGSTIRRIEQNLNRKIKIVEFNPSIPQFVRNLAAPLQVDDAMHENDVVILKSKDSSTRSMLIGKAGKNLRDMEEIARRYFTIKEIKVE